MGTSQELNAAGFTHVVLVRYGAAADAAFLAAVDDLVARARRDCKGLVSFHHVRNVADRGRGFDWAVIGVFASSADHDAYQISPVHQEMKAVMMPVIEDMVVLDAALR